MRWSSKGKESGDDDDIILMSRPALEHARKRYSAHLGRTFGKFTLIPSRLRDDSAAAAAECLSDALRWVARLFYLTALRMYYADVYTAAEQTRRGNFIV